MQLISLLRLSLSEHEAIIYLLVNGNNDFKGMNYRELGNRLGMSHYYVGKMYNQAERKIKQLKQAGLFPEELQKKD